MSIIIKNKRRQRYISFIVKNKHINFTKFEIYKEIQNQCKKMFKKEIKEMGIRLIRLEGGMGILKCNHIEKENVIFLLRKINKIGSNKVEIETLSTSGTIRSLVNEKKIDCL